MELEFDLSSFIVGDEFTGNTKELRQFIRSVLGASGTVQMVSNQTARIITLKVESPKEPEPPALKLTKEVKSDAPHQLRSPSPWADHPAAPLRLVDGGDPGNAV